MNAGKSERRYRRQSITATDIVATNDREFMLSGYSALDINLIFVFRTFSYRTIMDS